MPIKRGVNYSMKTQHNTYNITITDPDGQVLLSTDLSREDVEEHAMTKTQRIKRIASNITHSIHTTDK